MNSLSLKLQAYKFLQIHRGEGKRILSFTFLQFFLSLVVGMISSVVDPLFIKHALDAPETAVLEFFTFSETFKHSPNLQLSFFLYAVSSLVLALLGLLYTGVTDRFDKRKLFHTSLLATLAVCLAGGVLLLLNWYFITIPGVYSLLFVFRFIAGIVLLMVFWDIAPFYFDARQGKRLFPLLAMGGAAGYAVGSFIVAPLTLFVPLRSQLFVIALFTVPCIAAFVFTRRNFSILDSPRYKKMSLRSEIREGIFSFSGSSFLRLAAGSTVVFGLLAGLIIFTYNSVVNARVDTGAATANLMGLQRAAATILQATVLTRVMSQSSLGGQHKRDILAQILFLLLGIAAFFISMVGVADFTRQIQIALLSPAAVAVFAFVPSRYRGRIMALNNLVLAPLGIFLVSVIVLTAGSFISPIWFIYPIAALMIGRIVLNHFLNKKYVSLLSENLMTESKLDLVKIKDNARSIIDNPLLLEKLQAELAGQSLSVKVFLCGRLAAGAETLEDLERLKTFFPEDAPETIRALWIEALARVGFDAYEEILRTETDSPLKEVRIVARLAVLRHLRATGDEIGYKAFLGRLAAELEEAERRKDGAAFEGTAALLLRFETETGEKILSISQTSLAPELRGPLLSVIALYPRADYLPFVIEGLKDEELRKQAVAGLKEMPEKNLLERKDVFAGLSVSETLSILEDLVFSHPEFADRESAAILSALLESFGTGSPSPKETFKLFHSSGEDIIKALYILASGPEAAPASLVPLLRSTSSKLLLLFPYLCALLRATDDLKTTRYYPLLVKLVREETKILTLALLALAAAEMKTEEDRDLACGIVRELLDRTAEMGQNAMEFIDTKISADLKNPLLLFYETLTEEEQHLRMRPFLRGLAVDAEGILEAWLPVLASEEDAVKAEILREFLAALRKGRSPAPAPT